MTRTCPAPPLRLGAPPAEGEVCGIRGRFQIGGLWLCLTHYRMALQDAVALGRAEQGIVVPLDACVFPALRSGRSGTLCGEPATETAGGAPACELHYSRALRWHWDLSAAEKRAADELEVGLSAEAERRREAEMRSWAASGSQIVYYLRRTDGAVKIGTSANFRSRLRDLEDEHGELEILLTHCGGFPREKEMHRKFADLALGREWFRAEKPLLSWIAWVRRRRVNRRTLISGTVPERYILALLREEQSRRAAFVDPAA